MVFLIVKLVRAAFDGSLGDLPGWFDDNDISDRQELHLTALLGLLLAALTAGLSSALALAIDSAIPFDHGWLLGEE